jgi:lipopolysaccharide transport system ATP-binding protein
MNDYAIKVENLSKLYKIGAFRSRSTYKTLQETIISAARRPFNKVLKTNSSHNNLTDLWALKDVSFEIARGEVFGIIGRNGAGKSTLLKVLSHITEPTKGKVRLRGRVGTLLEVGTGFHPELTGRENIYLNGSIMGMKHAEIDRKFDEIVAFSEVEKFLDTPVKRFSSGMYVRLAFAVAAHLQPEILLVDEVLAVGDNEFQKKCLGKLGDVANDGRTVLFVSHNLGAIETLCKKGILFENGKVNCIGKITDVISKYTQKNLDELEKPFENCNRSGNGKIRITGFHIENTEGQVVTYVTSGCPVVFVINYVTNGEKCNNVSMGISLHKADDTSLFLHYSHFSDQLFNNIPEKGEFRCRIDDFPLSPGNFLIRFRVTDNGIEADWPKVGVPISVNIGDFYRTGSFDGSLISWGPILVRGDWSLKPSI